MRAKTANTDQSDSAAAGPAPVAAVATADDDARIGGQGEDHGTSARRAHTRRQQRHETGREQHNQLVHAGQERAERAQPENGEANRLDRTAPQRPEREDNDRDDHRRDAVEQARDLRQRAVAHVGPRDQADDDCRRQDEAAAGNEQPRPAVPRHPDVDRELGRVRARDEVGRTEVVEELIAREPRSTAHDLVLHHRDVRRGPAERRRPQAEKEKRGFDERGRAASWACLDTARMRKSCQKAMGRR